MNERTFFILLLTITCGLWTNLLLLRIPATAQERHTYTLQSVSARLLTIQSDLTELKRQMDEVKDSLTEIKTGTCRNPKIC